MLLLMMMMIMMMMLRPTQPPTVRGMEKLTGYGAKA